MNKPFANCKDNRVSLYIGMDDGSIFQYSIQICVGNDIHNLVTFLRVVQFCATSTTKKYKIV